MAERGTPGPQDASNAPAVEQVREELVEARHDAAEARQDVADATAARDAAEASEDRLQAMVAGLNAIVWERDPETLRVRFINQRAEAVLGYPVVRWQDDPGLEEQIVHPGDREEMLTNLRRGIAAEDDFSLCYRARAADGRWLWLQHLGHVARDGSGAARALHGVLLDITAQQRREQATALLAAAGRVLSEPGSLEQRLTAVADLTVDELCDRAEVWLRGPDGRFRPVAVAPAEAAEAIMTLEPATAADAVTDALRSGQPVVVPHLVDTLRSTRTDEPAQLAAMAALDALGTRDALLAPLRTGDQLLGVLTLAATDARQFTDPDLTLARELAQRIATAVTAERLTTERRQLHEITADLASAGTVADAADAVTRGLRQALEASVVAVCTCRPDRQLHVVGVHGVHADRWSEFTVMPLVDTLPLTDAAATGRTVWLPDRDAIAERYPAVLTSLEPDTQAMAALPLTVGSRLVGALGLTFTTARPFDPEERAFLHTVAGQVALAFERAALADVRSEMAETLQRSLLPGRLTVPDGLAATTRYLPAVEGTSAGGDWYDVLPLSDGEVAVAVGDVVGNGATAAAVMGQLRSALAGLLLAGFGPARALELLDRFAEHVVGARVTTVACLRIDPESGRLTYSRAGHPPAMIVDEDGATLLDGGLGPALGLPVTGPRPEARTTLRAGATLLAFTDGLIERDGATLDEGLHHLSAASAPRPPMTLDALVDDLLARLVDGDGAGDDIALVALRLRPQPLRLELPADPAQLYRLRRSVARWATSAPLDEEATEDLQLALGEAVGNAVEHAYREREPGTVTVQLDVDGGEVRAAVSDGGSWQPIAEDPGFRGRGLQIIDALGHDVEVEGRPDGTTLRFRFTPAPSPAHRAVVQASASGIPRQEQRRRRPARLEAEDRGERRYVHLSGELDLAGVHAVRSQLLAELSDGSRPVTLDVSAVDFLASVGIGLLLEVADHVPAHGDLDLVLPPAGPARRALDLTGLTTVLQRPGRPAPA